MARITLVIYVIACLCIATCTNPYTSTRQYKGRIIQLDYANIESIEDSSWIKIDNWKFTHYRSMKAAKENQYSLPTTYTLIDSVENRSFGTSVNSRGMGLYIAQNLNHINKAELPSDSAKYKILDPPLITLEGIIKLAKTDSGTITVEVPKGYPAKIDVVEQ